MAIKVNDTDLKVLSLFTKGYDKEYYIREAAKLVKVSPRTVMITLQKLEQLGILESKVRGKIKAYRIRNSFISREFFIFAEHYKSIQFLEKNPLIKEILEKADDFLGGIVIIFGSYAKGTQKDDSDLDLFVAGSYDEKEIGKIGNKYGVEVNIKSYPIEIFDKELRKDILLKEIVENHVLVKDSGAFVRRVLKWTR